ncbi:proton-translocating NADH-quinone oxidoreductase, chain N [Thioalkalivibrio sulfidiphilus HL-EbGr7]|uniref:NADH-quinone oxidoreductase subunit N n=1 Tax=Thioalkalivibrio sulfidiphilus (strain HL-EbGR7) TaxID=396588 RepID=NUON_THISH|nr:NADH-quinone oxidoreductase subunit NuoN [Thioalkalivibrio sulfidiphilus]B8GNZ8.1 RecName: Full=NADH-quinone oxidoreductase subunit N; AltName: Full=NADH dehydrogenase I subunit N; AltName: Full=NDH-1 subunit N [Thioalkalivibrio sulfidiphilus HL-EbGr7]ACL72087.1 proton-translocating NADH-quinone oxidoreductase, chain N [Thioalkalivibrio sulfidiphilus HL-EbGr7]
MTFEIPDFMPVIPELFVLGMACAILVIDLFVPQSRRDITYGLSQFTLIGAAILTIALASPETRFTFNDTFIADGLSDLLKVAVYLITAVVFLYSRPYLQDRDIYKGEYYVLGLFGVLGMMIMISSYSFLTLYLGLELLSLSLYAMVAFNRDSARASEAAMKYFILGAIASGMLLYGMSILYGITGSLDIKEVSDYLITSGAGLNVPLVFALSFVIVGLAFKLGAVPFHMWVPDVYHGAPTSVTLFIGTAPKLAGLAIIMRLLVDGLGPLHHDWQGMLTILAVLSLAVGNVVAIAQTNIKRMLAYSTISHVGFILMGILAGTHEGYAAALFYTLVYAIVAAGGFGMIILLSRRGFEAENLDDFRGLNERSPWFAFIMLLIMFSMAGVPPTVGFYAKLAVLQAVVQVEMIWLAIFAVIFSIVGAFYYLRAVKIMYFDKPEDESPLPKALDMNVVLSINGLLVIVLGIFPGLLMSLATGAISW